MKLDGVKSWFHKGGQALQENMPEIAFAVGLVSGVMAMAAAAYESLKTEEILDEHREHMEKIEDNAAYLEEHDTETENDYEMLQKKAKVGRCAKTFGKLALNYAPAIALEVVSITSLLASRSLAEKRYRTKVEDLKRQYLGAVAAFNGLAQLFKTYRERNISLHGEKADRQCLYGSEYTKEKVTVVDEKGEKKKETVETEHVVVTDPGDFVRVFDSDNPNYDSNPTYTMFFLKSQQNRWNDILVTRGHVFLNEVLDSLGFEHTTAGSALGWIYDKESHGEGHIDFGLYNLKDPKTRRFINGEEDSILLSFNVDGIIWDKISNL